MTTEDAEASLSDEEIGLLMEGKARKLLRGEKTRYELIEDMVKLLAAEPNVIVRTTPLRSQGRCSFGRRNEGTDGTALFVKHTHIA